MREVIEMIVSLILAWLIVVGGFAIFMVTLRLLAWIFEVTMLRGW